MKEVWYPMPIHPCKYYEKDLTFANNQLGEMGVSCGCTNATKQINFKYLESLLCEWNKNNPLKQFLVANFPEHSFIRILICLKNDFNKDIGYYLYLPGIFVYTNEFLKENALQKRRYL